MRVATIVLVLGMCAPSALGATFTMVPAAVTIDPGEEVVIDVFVDEVTEAVAGYSVWFDVTGGTSGTLAYDFDASGVTTSRSDWIFNDATGLSFPIVNADYAVLGGVANPGHTFTGSRYLGTGVFKASSDARGTFNIGYQDVNGDYTTVLGELSQQLELTEVNGCVVTIDVSSTDTCATDAVPIGDGRTAIDNRGYNTDGPALTCDGTHELVADAWYEYTATCDGVLTVTTCDSAGFDTALAVYGGTSTTCSCPTSNANMMACNDDGASCGGGTSEVSLSAVAGNCYTIRIGGSDNGGSDYEGIGNVDVVCIGNDTCETAEPIVSLPASVPGGTINTGVNDDVGQPECGRAIDSPGVWYTVLGTGRRMTASLCFGANYNTAISVYEGNCGDLTCVVAGDNECGVQAEVAWCSQLNRAYRILVHGAGGEEGTFVLSVADDDCSDGNFCTTDTCVAGACVSVDDTPSTHCCNPTTGLLTEIDDDNPCNIDTCQANGTVTRTPGPDGPNAACEDGDTCTRDECLGGVCVAYSDVGNPCEDDGDCYGGSCVGDVCVCVDRPSLDLVPQASPYGDGTCYRVGDVLTVDITLEPGPTTIVGGQFFLEYDPQVLDFVSMVPGDPPFTFEVFESVDEIGGTIDYTVLVPFGSEGTTQGGILATMAFNVIDECSPYLAFRNHEPPTRLSDPNMQEVQPFLGNGGLLADVSSDGSPPTAAVCPGDVSVPPDPGVFYAVVTWPALDPATDGCDGTIPMTCSPPSGSAFPIGVTPVTCSAMDACGRASSCSFDVEVRQMTLTMDIEISPVVAAATFDRCITFELCDAAGGLLEEVDEYVTFIRSGTTAIAEDVVIEIPGGSWGCITARDPAHTLTSRAPTVLVSPDGLDYTANFVGDRSLGGHWLVQGNLNDDNWVDILDLGGFLGSFLSPLNPDTPCGTALPHADLNGDGIVNVADFAMVQINLFEGSEPACPCSTALIGGRMTPGPIRAMSVEELRRRGYLELAKADKDHDGKVNLREAQARILERLRKTDAPTKVPADNTIGNQPGKRPVPKRVRTRP